jgi:uncharacterized repeat protein (TIGR01451 family)/fimbrial isopeptide formation D2 family protein
MFKKLISNLPFNPSLLDQTNFYLKRLRQETAIRRIGFFLISLSFIVQLLAVMYPAQKSLAASPNDIYSGITDKNSLVQAWDNNAHNVRVIYSKFGITRANISAATSVTVVSKQGSGLWSVGRMPLSQFGINSKDWGEREIDLGDYSIFQRPLHAWDAGGSVSYPAFHGTNQYGIDFWILKTCGNPTFKGPYLPSPPRPELEIHKTRTSPAAVKPGDYIDYTIEYRNAKKDSLASNVKVIDNLNNELQFVSLEDKTSQSDDPLVISIPGEMGYRAIPFKSMLRVKVKDTVFDGEIICNQAFIDSDDTGRQASPEKPCVTVSKPKKTSTPTPTPTPVTPTPTTPPPPPAVIPPNGTCIATLSSASASSIYLTTTAYVQNAKVLGYSFDVDSNGSVDYNDSSSATSYQKLISGLSPGFHSFLVYVQVEGTDGQKIQSQACEAEINLSETPRVTLSKAVTNITQNISNASNTTVRSGDVLEFKLTTTNVTSSDYPNYQASDYLGDVLQYAEIIDSASLSDQGISLGSDNYLRWSLNNLKAHTSDIKTIRVKVKEIIPTTNTPSNISPDYDCRISNDYGNEVLMNVECPLVKEVAKNATALPNTGPGTTVIIGFMVTAVVGYFFARAKIMAKEVEVIKDSYSA